MIALYIFLFFAGSALGSFIAVLIERLPEGRPVLNARSECVSCHKKLSGLELIPVISFLIQKGKCKSCNKSISSTLFVSEVISGLFLVLLFFIGFANSLSLPFLVFASFLVYMMAVIFFIDLKHGIIPDEILVVLGIATFFYLVVFNPGAFVESILSGLGAFVFFLLLFIITRSRGIGFGDVKFAFIIGLITGFPGVITAFYISFLSGAAISLMLILLRRKKLKGSTVPFGPFLVFGTLSAFFWGDIIWNFIIRFYQ